MFTAVRYINKNVGLLDFQSNHKNIFAHHLYYSRLRPLAEIKTMSNVLEHAMLGQCMIALSMCMLLSLWPLHSSTQCLQDYVA